MEGSRTIKEKLRRAVEEMKSVLQKGKSAILLGDQDHTYLDKFTVSEAITNNTTKGFKTTLESLGFPNSLQIDKTKNIIMRFDYAESCTFKDTERKTVNVVEVTHKQETNTSSTEIGTVVEEHVWVVNISAHLYLIYGGEQIPFADIFSKHSDEFIIRTSIKEPPRKDGVQSLDLDVTCLFDLYPFSEVHFKIDRNDKKCFTPCRNKESEKYQNIMQELITWGSKCDGILFDQLLELADTVENTNFEEYFKIFTPIAPIFGEDDMQEDGKVYVQCHEASLKENKEKVNSLFKDSEFVQDNCNPIEVIEQSALVLTKEILGRRLEDLISQSEIPRMKQFAPQLFE
ncbi:hypothetical protein HDV06_006708 [Boothiomyces sp. JEL0866]|nr:hypothetical protein HDV06_006708 [Boothiomyces sp. JEL0866]